MNDFVMPLLLELDVCSLTMSLVNIASVTGAESAIADSIEAALRTASHLDVHRDGDTVIAHADGEDRERVVVVGRLDTAPSEEAPAYVEMGKLVGPGASGAKGALAMCLKAVAVGGYRHDVTFVFRADGHDVGDELRRADFALIAEPTDSVVVGAELEHPWAQHLIELTDREAAADAGAYGLASLGVPAVAFGPGELSVAGTPGEFVATAQLTQCEFVLRQWLRGCS